LQWCLCLAAKNPEEQDKLYRELIGIEGDLTSKVESLPVLRNFIDEALRWVGIASPSVRGSKAKDIVLPEGVAIPKGTSIYMPIKCCKMRLYETDLRTLCLIGSTTLSKEAKNSNLSVQHEAELVQGLNRSRDF
jgi:hypothetical protein